MELWGYDQNLSETITTDLRKALTLIAVSVEIWQFVVWNVGRTWQTGIWECIPWCIGSISEGQGPFPTVLYKLVSFHRCMWRHAEEGKMLVKFVYWLVRGQSV